MTHFITCNGRNDRDNVEAPNNIIHAIASYNEIALKPRGIAMYDVKEYDEPARRWR